MLLKYPLYYHTFGAPMATRNKQVSSVLVKNTLYASSFTSGTDGWVATSNATLSNVYGNIRATVTALNAGMQKTFSTEAGKTYRIRFKVNLRGWPYMYVKDVASTSNLMSVTDFMTPGDYSYTFTATGYQTNVIFHEAGNASGSVQICNFTLEEVEAENGYRFGFQGQERDDELKGDGNSIVFEYRVHDPRIGRFLSEDPLVEEYPELSPYAFSGNQVIHTTELEGAEPLDYIGLGDHVGTFQSSTQYEYESNPTKAAIIDAMFLVVNFTGFNLVDNYITTVTDPNLTASEKINVTVQTVNEAMQPAAVKVKATPKLTLPEVKIKIAPKDKIPRSELNPPKKKGNAPTFKKDGSSVEIHHVDQKRKGPFKEMHKDDHRGKGNDKKNHPNKNKPSEIERKEFKKAKAKYWSTEFPTEPPTPPATPPATAPASIPPPIQS